MFPNTQKIDYLISKLRERGETPENSLRMRELMIAQAAPYFPEIDRDKNAEEHLIDRRIIPLLKKKK